MFRVLRLVVRRRRSRSGCRWTRSSATFSPSYGSSGGASSDSFPSPSSSGGRTRTPSRCPGARAGLSIGRPHGYRDPYSPRPRLQVTRRRRVQLHATPTYQAQAYDARTGRQVWRTFATRSAAKLWRQDAQVALRRGTMRPPTARTIGEAADVLIAGAHDGTILDRGGKPYKPSTARGYEAAAPVVRSASSR